mmetsp:Transcript_20786/g.49132  ORF Transcript_20786/g.49132 Transcript_20786/m.49132 type:complete len:261 (+) Transcript_20786:63-845(+)
MYLCTCIHPAYKCWQIKNPPCLGASADGFANLLDIKMIPEGSLFIGNFLALSTEGDEGSSDDADGGDETDSNADNGPGRERVLAVGDHLVDDVAEVFGLLNAVLLHHGGLAAQLLDLVLDVVDISGNVGVDVVEGVIIDADVGEEVLEERFPVVNVRSVGSVLGEVVLESARLDGELDLDVLHGIVVELVLADAESFEDTGVVVISGVGAVCARNFERVEGGLDANVQGKGVDGLVQLVDVLVVVLGVGIVKTHGAEAIV